MRPLQWARLGASIIIGMIWVFSIQKELLLNVFSGAIAGPGLNVQQFVNNGITPAFTVFWIGCMTALLIWFARTMNARPHSSTEVLLMQPQWWIAAVLLGLFGWICLSVFTILIWQVTGTSPIDVPTINYYPVPAGGWILLSFFVLLDVIVLFWLPTMLASPRLYRIVVPGAFTIFASR
jgi:hypothetical protein